MRGDDGFRFDFGDGNCGVTGVPVTASHAAGDTPSTPITSFPWQPLLPSLLDEWGRRYPARTMSGDGARGECLGPTKPQQLSLSSTASPGTTYVLAYQSAPEVEALTEARDVNEGAGMGETASRELRDIVPGKYYGGLKVWSCAPYLAAYMVDHESTFRPLLSASAVVMEVGCGHGLLGMLAVLFGAKRVCFQDYNVEVLELCVKPNVAATMLQSSTGASAASQAAVQLVHGDWGEFSWPSEDCLCDVVLGSDVTFDLPACEKLAHLLSRCLRPGRGIAFIASKVYYYGTAGGSLEFATYAARYGLRVQEVNHTATNGCIPQTILKATKPDV